MNRVPVISKQRNTGKENRAAMAAYMRMIQEDNSEEIDQMKRKLRNAMREDLTAKQREDMYAYYVEGLNMQEIAERTGRWASTISRNIQNGRAKLKKILKYTNRYTLESAGINTESGLSAAAAAAVRQAHRINDEPDIRKRIDAMNQAEQMAAHQERTLLFITDGDGTHTIVGVISGRGYYVLAEHPEIE